MTEIRRGDRIRVNRTAKPFPGREGKARSVQYYGGLFVLAVFAIDEKQEQLAWYPASDLEVIL